MDVAYRIRHAVAADIENVFALERRIDTVPHWAMADYLGALAQAESTMREAGTRRCFFVALAGETVVGFAIGRVAALEAEVLAELESVGVADGDRRKGVGRDLTTKVIGWARQQGATVIELEVRSKIDGAIALYSGLGFLKTGLRRKYYRSPGDDAILMRLGLAGRGMGRADADSLWE